LKHRLRPMAVRRVMRFGGGEGEIASASGGKNCMTMGATTHRFERNSWEARPIGIELALCFYSLATAKFGAGVSILGPIFLCAVMGVFGGCGTSCAMAGRPHFASKWARKFQLDWVVHLGRFRPCDAILCMIVPGSSFWGGR